MIKNAIWLGPLLAIAGCITYFWIFSQFPITRDFPWVNLPMAALGFLLSLIALLKWKKSGKFMQFILGAGTAVSAFFAGILFLYVFVISSNMPMPKVLGFQKDPKTLSLQATGDRTISLGDHPDKRILVSFFRGYW